MLGYDICKLLRCLWRKSFARIGPGFWRDILDLPVGHGRQTGEDIAEVSVGFDTVAAAALNDRVDDRATFSSVGVAEEEPVLFSKSGRANRILNQIIIDFDLRVLQINFQ